MSEQTESQTPSLSALAEIGRHLRAMCIARPWLIVGYALFMLLAVASDLLLPFASSRLVGALGSNASDHAHQSALWAYCLFTVLAGCFFLLRNIGVRLWNPFLAESMSEIASRAFRDVQRLSSQWHADNSSGATVRQLSRAMWALYSVADALAWQLLPAGLVLVGVVIALAIEWPTIAAFAAFMIIAFVVSTWLLVKHYTLDAADAANHADTEIAAALTDVIIANSTVREFATEENEQERFDDVVKKWREVSKRSWQRNTNAWLIQNFVLFVLQAGLVGLVIFQWTRGLATATDAVFAITIFLLVAGYLRSLSTTIPNLQKGLTELADVIRLQSELSAIRDRPDAKAFQPAGGEISFDRVTFAYGNGECVFRDLSMKIRAGETLAVVGPSGSGKSTLIKLLKRFFDVDEGAIFIDGQDVRDVTQSSLRRAIAVVPQEPALFHRSVRQNIAYSHPDAPFELIVQSATRAGAHDFIMRLPGQYEAKIGERGVNLSGGERQRIALARALLTDAHILILDEATSALDVETASQVEEATHKPIAMRTTIVIAHRLSTVKRADRILVFRHGRVAEEGTHEELMAKSDWYSRINCLASGGDLYLDAAG